MSNLEPNLMLLQTFLKTAKAQADDQDLKAYLSCAKSQVQKTNLISIIWWDRTTFLCLSILVISQSPSFRQTDNKLASHRSFLIMIEMWENSLKHVWPTISDKLIERTKFYYALPQHWMQHSKTYISISWVQYRTQMVSTVCWLLPIY